MFCPWDFRDLVCWKRLRILIEEIAGQIPAREKEVAANRPVINRTTPDNMVPHSPIQLIRKPVRLRPTIPPLGVLGMTAEPSTITDDRAKAMLVARSMAIQPEINNGNEGSRSFLERKRDQAMAVRITGIHHEARPSISIRKAAKLAPTGPIQLLEPLSA